MADEREEPTGATPGEGAGEDQPQADAERDETAAGGTDERDEQLRLVREENERLRQQMAEREARTTEGRAEHPTTPAPSYEHALAEEARMIGVEEAAIMEKEATEGQSVETIRRAQKLLDRKSRLTTATMAHALKKTELNTFVATLPKEQRAAFREFVARKGHLFANLEVAFDGYEAGLLRAERGKSTEKTKRAEDIIKRNDEGRVTTTTREVSAAEARGKREKMTGAKFDDEFDRLIARGDHDGALVLSRRFAEGKIELDN